MRFIIFFATILLCACAATPGNDCSRENWYELGYQDGSNGRAAKKFDERSQQCRPQGELPDEEGWRAGYDDGLASFCSPAGGFAAGRDGRARPDVCPARLQNDFLKGFRLGRDIYAAEQRMQAIEREIRALEARQSGDLLNPALRDDSSARIRRLEQEYERLARELRLLDLRADHLTRK